MNPANRVTTNSSERAETAVAAFVLATGLAYCLATVLGSFLGAAIGLGVLAVAGAVYFGRSTSLLSGAVDVLAYFWWELGIGVGAGLAALVAIRWGASERRLLVGVIREVSDIARPVDEAPSWLECAQPISGPVRAHESHAGVTNRRLVERQLQTRPGCPVESEHGRAIGLAKLEPTKIATENGHMRVVHVAILRLVSRYARARSAAHRSPHRTSGFQRGPPRHSCG